MLNVLGEDTYARERDVYHKLTELKNYICNEVVDIKLISLVVL